MQSRETAAICQHMEVISFLPETLSPVGTIVRHHAEPPKNTTGPSFLSGIEYNQNFGRALESILFYMSL
jgi:hypothetical protein